MARPQAGPGPNYNPDDPTHESNHPIRREQVHNTDDDHGVIVPAARVIPPDSGWLCEPRNPVPYTGDNAPWRR